MDYSRIGRTFRRARKKQNLTQEVVSEKVGISLSFYGHIERGTRKASMETYVKLCLVLHMSMDTLFLDPSDTELRQMMGERSDERPVSVRAILGDLEQIIEKYG